MKSIKWPELALATLQMVVMAGGVSFPVSKGPLIASLANEDVAATEQTNPHGVDHPHVHTKLAPLGLGTNVLLTYVIEKVPHREVCFVHSWVLEGVAQDPGRYLVRCDHTDAAGKVSFMTTLPVADYGKQPALIAALYLHGEARQIDYLKLSR